MSIVSKLVSKLQKHGFVYYGYREVNGKILSCFVAEHDGSSLHVAIDTYNGDIVHSMTPIYKYEDFEREIIPQRWGDQTFESIIQCYSDLINGKL